MKTSCRTTACGAVTTMKVLKMMMVTVMMAMVMMAALCEAAAAPRESKSHRRKSEEPVVMFPLRLDPEAFVPPGHLRPLNNVSTSPWTYNVSRDEAVFPPLLSEARCSLRGCLDHQDRENLNLESRPILHQALVLRRVRDAGAGGVAQYQYRLETRLVAVGCTCVRRSVLLQH